MSDYISSSVVMYLPVKSFILMMIYSMVLILLYVNQPKTSKSITALCEYYCIIHLCHHLNFSFKTKSNTLLLEESKYY